MLIAHFFILFGCILLFVRTEKPFLCSGIYAGAHVFFSLLLEMKWTTILILGVVVFALASLYFWLLSRIQTGHLLWWVVLISGIFLGLV
jgi:hypothetical protein